jgi:hypothetical protein
MQARQMTDEPLGLEKHLGTAAQKGSRPAARAGRGFELFHGQLEN